MNVVFAGPTISAAEARDVLDVQVLPPVSQGDVYRAAQHRPEAIGIIDGYFDEVPAVWHKEILWALHRGIRVYGSSSMGALRAAELADFGMIGVGRIFDAFLRGELEDDDEVAMVHRSADEGYKPLSEPMVNIRATLAEACECGIVKADLRDLLIAVAKGLHYAERCYPAVLRLARARIPGRVVELAALEHWLPSGRIDRKRRDAIALFEAMRDARPESRPATFVFEPTTLWGEFCHQAGHRSMQVEGRRPQRPPTRPSSGRAPKGALLPRVETGTRQAGSPRTGGGS
jgi:hypothetical protein